MTPFDPIVALITGPPPSAVAVVRVSGPGSWSIARRVFDRLPDRPESHRAVYGRFCTGDDGLVLPFSEGHSYTGEEAVEMSIHGSAASIRALIGECLALGVRPAEPGEFTQRAFLNGRLDLTQAEAVRDTVEAETDAQLRMANLLRDGALRRELRGLSDRLAGVIASVEASLDFSEEVGPLDRDAARRTLEEVKIELEALRDSAGIGRILREGFRIAIVGPPNAGKSSLLNALLGTSRSIVTDIPGTTRDFIEERSDFNGLPVVLIDTAGLRETQDPIETVGVERSRSAASGADEIWYVYDATLGWTSEDGRIATSFTRPMRRIANKADLAHDQTADTAVSALTGQGIIKLAKEVAASIELASRAPLANQRHAGALAEAIESLDLARATLESSRPDDLAAVGLRSAMATIGTITGESASADMIERIFRDFCIGK